MNIGKLARRICFYWYEGSRIYHYSRAAMAFVPGANMYLQHRRLKSHWMRATCKYEKAHTEEIVEPMVWYCNMPAQLSAFCAI